MENNWVLLQGHLCHTPNYAATRKGLHKVSFRLAVPRAMRTNRSALNVSSAEWLEPKLAELPPFNAKSDYVTVIIIGKPAWDFKQLDLQAGAAVRVEGRLRSWDVFPEPSESSDNASQGVPQLERRDYHLEVIAEKVDPLNDLPQ